jgi:hypothetical protein
VLLLAGDDREVLHRLPEHGDELLHTEGDLGLIATHDGLGTVTLTVPTTAAAPVAGDPCLPAAADRGVADGLSAWWRAACAPPPEAVG